MNGSNLIVTVRVRTGWVRFLTAVAMRLADWRLPTLAALWLWVWQPLFIVGVKIDTGRWSCCRLPVRAHLYLLGRQPPDTDKEEGGSA